MTLIAFTKNHSDLSTDKGYQFKFHCDKCGNGYETSFSPSVVGMAGSFLRAAGSIFGGGLSSAGYGAYEVQRAIGGPAHDSAFKAAVEECKAHFCQCGNCGIWVCPEVCWNSQAGQCKGCAPDFQQQMVAAHAHAKVDAARSQLHEAAQKENYVAGMDMGANAVYRAPAPPNAYAGAPPPGPGAPNDPYRGAPQPWQQGAPPGYAPPGYGVPGYPQAPQAPPPVAAAPPPAVLPCATCRKPTAGLKFCEECGGPRAVACASCNQPLRAGAKFCGTCGTHV